MGQPQILKTDTEDLVVLKRADYEALLARAGDEDAEDAAAARILDASDAKIARGEDVMLPATVWEAIEAGEHPIAVLRKYRGLTQAALGERVKQSQGYISDLESGDKGGSPATLKAIAVALGVPMDVLVR